MKPLKIYKGSLEVKNHSKSLCLCLTKLRFLPKLSPLLPFDYSSSKTWLFGMINKKFQKDSSKNEVSKHFKMFLLQANKLVIPPRERGGLKIVLFYLLQ